MSILLKVRTSGGDAAWDRSKWRSRSTGERNVRTLTGPGFVARRLVPFRINRRCYPGFGLGAMWAPTRLGSGTATRRCVPGLR